MTMENFATSITQIHTSNVSELTKLKQLMNTVVDHLDQPVVNKAALEDILSLPNIVYYNDDHNKSPGCTTELSEINGAKWTLPSTWQELTREIERGEDKIVFHIDMITKSGESIKDFIKSLKTIVKFMPGHKPLKILVLITPTTTQQQIKELKASGIMGIGYDVTYYSFEQAAEATTALLAGEPYWPKDIINQLPVTEQKPMHIYIRSGYEDVTAIDSTVVPQYNQILPVRVEICDSWEDLSRLLKLDPHQIALHPNTLMSSTDRLYDVSLTELVSLIKTHLKLEKKDIPIALVVEKHTPRHIIKEAQSMSLQGLIPYHGQWSAEDTMAGLDALTNRVTHWPSHIIEQLPVEEKKPISIYFRKDAKEYINHVFTDPETIEMVKVAAWDPRICCNWDELGALLEQNPHQLIFHAGVISDEITVPEFVSMLETLIRISCNKKVPIGIAIEDTTPLKVVKEFQKCGVHGIIPSASTFGFVETTKGINALFNRIPYWPKNILEQLPGFIKRVNKPASIVLTHRQQQILQLIKERGASNKIIARVLGISESTVKLHITEIFKKYGVRSRTQLAVFSEKV